MLINVQLLRFIAATLVVLYHSSGQLADANAASGNVFAAMEAVGFAGVDVFFVISGYIMVHTTRALEGRAAASAFLRRRAARIYSGYWPFFILAVVVFAWANPGHLARAEWLESAFLWPARYLLIPVAWTLVFEMYFYLLFTGLVWLPGHRRTAITVATWVLVIGWVVWAWLVRDAYSPERLGLMTLTEYWLLSPYMLEFFGGALLATALHRRPTGLAWTWLLLGTGLFAFGGWVNVQFFDGHIEQGYWVTERVALFGTAALMIMAGLVRLEHRGFTAPLRFSLLAGGASYAIYLSHTLVLTATQKAGLNEFLRTFSDGVVQWTFAALSLGIILASMAWYRGPERRLHHAFRSALGVGRSD